MKGVEKRDPRILKWPQKGGRGLMRVSVCALTAGLFSDGELGREAG